MTLPATVSYILRAFPSPFTGNAALVVNTARPMHSVRGAGRPVYNQFQLFAPQIIQTNVQTLEGYGGLLTGQIAMQPLASQDPTGAS